MKEFEETTAEIFKKLLERMAELQNSAGSSQPVSTGPRNIGDVTAPDLIGAPPEELEGLGTVEEIAAPPAPPMKPKLAALMPGDSVRVKLLAGVNAPTDGTPYPVS